MIEIIIKCHHSGGISVFCKIIKTVVKIVFIIWEHFGQFIPDDRTPSLSALLLPARCNQSAFFYLDPNKTLGLKDDCCSKTLNKCIREVITRPSALGMSDPVMELENA